jgi:hypothetical protein
MFINKKITLNKNYDKNHEQMCMELMKHLIILLFSINRPPFGMNIQSNHRKFNMKK